MGIIIAIGFNIVFVRLNSLSNVSDDSKKRKKSQLFYALMIGGLFSFCFLAKSGIFVAFCVVQTITFPILLFAFLELVPTYALLFYIFPAQSPVYKALVRASILSAWTSVSTRSRSSSRSRSTSMKGGNSSSSKPSTGTNTS